MKQHYREFICCVCGGKGIDRGMSQNAIFCGQKCRNKGHRMGIRIENLSLCKHNDGVSCNNYNCEGCGWNPDIQQARLEKTYGGLDYGR